MYGDVAPKLVIGVTTVTAFSSQSVMTLANADVAALIVTPTQMMTAETERLMV
jgi:hypothetical protein